MPKIIEDNLIYEAVMQVISERGYSGATTQQMARTAGVSEVTLFRKYGSKQVLVKQTIAFIIAQADLGSAARYSGDLQADLLRVVQAYQDSAVKHGDFITSFFSEITRNPELVDSFDEPVNIFLGIGKLMLRYQTEGLLQKEPPIHSVAALLGPLMAAAMMRKTIKNEPIFPVDPREHVTKFLAGRRA